MNLLVDLMAGRGEGAGEGGELLAVVTSAHVVWGLDAGDSETVIRSVETACARKGAPGGGPRSLDRGDYGRNVLGDRSYFSDRSLVPRARPDALLHDPEDAAARVVRMLREGKVKSVDGVDVDVRAETVCVHGDTPGAVDFARVLKSRLEKEGVAIRAPRVSKEK